MNHLTFASQYRPGRYNRSRNAIAQDAAFMAAFIIFVLGGLAIVIAWAAGVL